MSTITLLLLALVGAAFAGTHVNISVAQHPADVTYVDGEAPSELKAGPNRNQNYRAQQNREYLGQFRTGHNNPKSEFENGWSGIIYSHEGRSARIQDANNSEQQQSQLQKKQSQSQQQRAFDDRTAQENGSNISRKHFRRPNAQDRKNQEFERYIQNYHSGPTVETVYESASPAPQRYQQSGSAAFSGASDSERIIAIGNQPKQMQAFERQVALPTGATTNLPSSENDRQTQTIVNHQPQPAPVVDTQEQNFHSGSPSTSSSSSSSSSSSPTLISTSNDAGNNVPYDAPAPSINPYDNRANYQPPNFSYDGSERTDLYNQYPTAFDENGAGYENGAGGFYGNGDQSNFYGESDASSNGYFPTQPTYARPLVTKTIQIVQPALKAKKYEVRHPAIQKEFYDIEERVVIKPAGTIVVELEHPVAKIPKGETILPLSHPHPAVASAYNQNGQSSTPTAFKSSIVNGSSSFSNFVKNPNGQYGSNPISKFAPTEQYSPRSNTISSSIATSPTYDVSSKDSFVEENLSRQYGSSAEPQFAPSTDRNYNGAKSNAADDFYHILDAQGNQRRISSKNITPNMLSKDEPDFKYPNQVDVRNNGVALNANSVSPTSSISPSDIPSASTSTTSPYANSQANSFNYNTHRINDIGSNAGPFTPNYSSNKPSLQHSFNGNANGNVNNNQYKGEFFTPEFYNKKNVNGNNNSNNMQREFKSARLQEAPVQRAPTAVHNIHLPPVQHKIYLNAVNRDTYAPRKENFGFNEHTARVFEIKPYFQQHQSSVEGYAPSAIRPQLERRSGGNTVQYSAPYSNMRYLPEEQRLEESNAKIMEEEQNKPSLADSNVPDNSQSTHIQIQIPHHPYEAHKPIVVSSTIAPPMDRQLQKQRQQQQVHSAVNYEMPSRYSGRGDQNYAVERFENLEKQPDCDQPTQFNANYEYPQSQGQQKFLRIVEATNSKSDDSDKALVPPTTNNIAAENIDVGLKSSLGHLTPAGQRVIAATPAPTDASSASETLHKRRIVVNHPFQTVREVVEHEPITNYHQIQVNEPAMHALYHQAPYIETHDSLRQAPVVDTSMQSRYNTHSGRYN